jgi:hypothetical protein
MIDIMSAREPNMPARLVNDECQSRSLQNSDRHEVGSVIESTYKKGTKKYENGKKS